MRDPLTGLFNRRYLDEMFSRELSRAARKGAPRSVLMVDIDYFKPINDGFGHAAGDEVLRQVARHLASNVRREDIVCRFGGEEFAMIMPDLSTDQAIERADKLRRGLTCVQVEVAGRPLGAVTASFGVAAYSGHGTTTCDALIAAAETAWWRRRSKRANPPASTTRNASGGARSADLLTGPNGSRLAPHIGRSLTVDRALS